MAKRKEATPTKASESMICRMVAKFLRIPQVESLEELRLGCQDADRLDPILDFVGDVDGLYAWNVDVAASIMGEKTTPLTEHLVSMPNRLYLVRDTVRPLIDSMWLASADLHPSREGPLNSLAFRGLMHSFSVAGEVSLVTAIQLSSCRQ
tara:strand:- start:196 stop:645 length:450 start_codon:yes stop_codon:yes gene_type:complete